MGTPEITDEHREKLKAGQAATKAIRAYLEALKVLKPKHGRPSTKTVDDLKIELLKLEAEIEQLEGEDVIKKLKMLPKVDAINEAIRDRMAADQARERLDELAEGFIKHAAAYGENNGITYDHWTTMRVPPEVLDRAGIKRQG